MIPKFKIEQSKPSKPDWMKLGATVKTCGWCGKIIEIAESERAIYVRIFGAKSIFYGNTGGDFVEYIPEIVMPVSSSEFVEDCELYIRRENEKLKQIRNLIEEQTSALSS